MPPPSDPTRQALEVRLVTIDDVAQVGESWVATGKDDSGINYVIDLMSLPPGTQAFPDQGEKWWVERRTGQWRCLFKVVDTETNHGLGPGYILPGTVSAYGPGWGQVLLDGDLDYGRVWYNNWNPDIADGDNVGRTYYMFKTGPSTFAIAAQVDVRADDVTAGTEDGRIVFKVMNAGTLQDMLTMLPLGVVLEENELYEDSRTRSLKWATGYSTPEGSADFVRGPGSMFLSRDGGELDTAWVKTGTGTNNTGWRRMRSPQLLGGFTIEAADAATNTQMLRACGTAATTTGWTARSMVMDRAGRIMGVTAGSSAARTAGTLTFTVYKSGGATAIATTLDSNRTQYNWSGSASGVSFVAGDTLDIRCTNASFTPTTAQCEASLSLLYD